MTWIGKLALLPLLASASQDTVPTIRTETRAVQIDVTVRDRHGVPVRGLTKDDFTLLDDGKPRGISFFSAEPGESLRNEAPLNTPSAPAAVATPPLSSTRVLSNTAPSNSPKEAVTVILFDASSPALDLTTDFIGLGLLAHVRQDAMDVMAKLPVKERIAVYQISPSGLKIVQDFTTDRDLLRKSIKAWSIPNDWKPCNPDPNIDPACYAAPLMNEQLIQMGAISVLDSMRVIGEKLARLPGRKNVIWLTAGFPMRWLRRMDTQSQKTLAQLNDANIALNAVDVRGVGPGLNDPQVKVMQSMTEATGGKTYLQNDIGRAILESEEASRTNYTLGFYLADNERDGNFHKLELRVDRPGLSLSYRKGYVAGKTGGSKPTKEAPETELLNPVDATGIGISGTAGVTSGEPHPAVHLKLSLDGRDLALQPRRDNRLAFKLSRTVVEMDARGVTLVEAQDSKEFVVPTKSLDTIHRGGIRLDWEQTLPLMMGAATVRVIVRDKATGQTGTLTVPVR